jgi:hypothetical protein
MNSLNIAYCPTCRRELEKFGYLAVHIFEHACQRYCQQEPDDFTQRMYAKTTICEFLESKGFMVSTEDGLDSIAYKPLGVKHSYCDEYEYMVCVNPNDHNF